MQKIPFLGCRASLHETLIAGPALRLLWALGGGVKKDTRLPSLKSSQPRGAGGQVRRATGREQRRPRRTAGTRAKDRAFGSRLTPETSVGARQEDELQGKVASAADGANVGSDEWRREPAAPRPHSASIPLNLTPVGADPTSEPH